MFFGLMGLLAGWVELPQGLDALLARLAASIGGDVLRVPADGLDGLGLLGFSGVVFGLGIFIGWLSGVRRRCHKGGDAGEGAQAPGGAEAWRGQQDAAVRAERMAMAAELHDSVAQALCHLRLLSVRLDRQLALEAGSPGSAALAGELRKGLGASYSELRGLLNAFRLGGPAGGLAQAIRRLAESFRGRTGIAVRLDLDEEAAAGLTPGQQHEVRLIVGEALANVARHARAGSVAVFLRRAGDGALLAGVEDDGRGIQRMLRRSGRFGLEIMRERALRAGGELAVAERPGGGTCLTLRIHPDQDSRPHDVETGKVKP